MARLFDGATAQLATPVTAVLRPILPVTISAWVKADTFPAGGGIFTSNRTDGTYRGFWFHLNDTSGHLSATYGDGAGNTPSDRRSLTSTDALRLGVWMHVAACIRGAGNMDIYLDGKDAGGAYSGTGGTMGHNTSVGGRIGNVGGDLFDGSIAEVALWKVGLSTSEIQRLSRGVSPAMIRSSSLSGYWPLEHDLLDRTANRNDATVQAGTLPVVATDIPRFPYPLPPVPEPPPVVNEMRPGTIGPATVVYEPNLVPGAPAFAPFISATTVLYAQSIAYSVYSSFITSTAQLFEHSMRRSSITLPSVYGPTSLVFTPKLARPLVNVSPPAVSGSAVEGQALTASAGVWSGTEPITYGYQWRRCNAAGASCVDITGETASSYIVQAADVGGTLRVTVTAEDAA